MLVKVKNSAQSLEGKVPVVNWSHLTRYQRKLFDNKEEAKVWLISVLFIMQLDVELELKLILNFIL